MMKLPGNWPAYAVASGIFLSALVSVAVDRWDAGRMPEETLVREANAALVAALDQDALDTIVRTYPHWFVNARLGLDRLPILAGRQPDAWEAQRYPRLVQSFPEAYRDWADRDAELLGLSDFEAIFERDGYVIRRAHTRSDAPTVLWDGMDALRAASVKQLPPDGQELACDTWTREGWHCGRFHPFIHVSASLQQMGDQDPHRCILANAPEGGSTWSISWTLPSSVGTSNPSTLRWRAGNTFEAVRADRGAPVELSVLVDGEPVNQRVFPIHDTDYTERSIPLDAGAETLEFRIRAESHMDRFFCFYPQVTSP